MKQTEKMDKLWEFIASYRKSDQKSIIDSMAHHLGFTLCKSRYTTSNVDVYDGIALSIRDHLVELWNDTQHTYDEQGCKKVYYLSLEYLIGRSLRNNLVNLNLYQAYQKAVAEIGFDLEEVEELEHDAGLGNGGLGRLAACFLDSMAALKLPAYGYGIRYEYGIFQQKIENGQQVEHPDLWLSEGYPWEIPRWELSVPIKFYGHVHQYKDEQGVSRYNWLDTQDVVAVPFDVPISGYGTRTVNNLRLWSARSSKDFDFQLFNAGDFLRAVEEKQKSETISKVLYPNDTGFLGKELRLKQQYFFVSASLQDIIRRYKMSHDSFDHFPEQIAIQLNDTHPAIAVPELMRLLVDEEGLEWQKAWSIVTHVCAYTNHTVMPEALEKWSVELMDNLLPRLLQIIYDINHTFLNEVRKKRPHDVDMLRRISLIDEGDYGRNKQVRMANLAIVGSHTINGVSALHSDLLKTTIFQDFFKLFPEKFQNKTNGITPRLWLRCANPELSELISSKIGDSWITNLDDLKKLVPLAEDADFHKEWQAVKRKKKEQLAAILLERQGIELNVDSIFDVQVKRMHEYKRQLLNILYTIVLYNRIRRNPEGDYVPRTIMIGGKAAPGYYMAKLVIRLASDVGRVVNADPVLQDRLKFVFLENYSVSFAEKIIPATELSQQISTAGTEASGTGNMKFCLNGGIIIGTMDGANIEIREEVGEDNIFIFGLTTPQVMEARKKGYSPRDYYTNNPELKEALDMINSGFFNKDNPNLYNDIYNALTYDDYYMLLADFMSYCACQERVNQAYLDQEQWTKMSILNTAKIGKFSSDRTIQEYAEEIWGVEPVEIQPVEVSKR